MTNRKVWIVVLIVLLLSVIVSGCFEEQNKIKKMSDMPCPKCGGDGLYDYPPYYYNEKCPWCGGSGKYEDYLKGPWKI
jgi:DnaJ-class molecular chaperone